MTAKKQTIAISEETHKRLKIRAVSEGLRLSELAEKILKKALTGKGSA